TPPISASHAPATEVGPKDDFGLKVVDHAREHDVVFKVRSQRPWLDRSDGGEHDGYPEIARWRGGAEQTAHVDRWRVGR
ncbi:MAG: hypothetical protein WCD87_16590, partial [Pseudolabrys sp.]